MGDWADEKAKDIVRNNIDHGEGGRWLERFIAAALRDAVEQERAGCIETVIQTPNGFREAMGVLSSDPAVTDTQRHMQKTCYELRQKIAAAIRARSGGE